MDTSLNKLQQIEREQGICRTKIGTNEWVVKKLPALPAVELWALLTQKFLAPLGNAIDNGISFKEMLPEDRNIFAELGLHLSNSLGNFDIRSFIFLLLDKATRNGKPVDVEKDLIPISEMLSILEFALKENFEDFFTVWFKEKGLGIHTLTESLQQKVKMFSESPQQ